jgi:DnaJ-class molecular chaperone
MQRYILSFCIDMDNDFYSIIGCKIKSNNDEILKSYKNKIKKFEKEIEYDQQTKNEIKLLKIAKYVLTNEILRDKYDKMINNNYLEEQNELRINLDDNNTASRRDLKLDQTEKSDALSNRIFERFEFE